MVFTRKDNSRLVERKRQYVANIIAATHRHQQPFDAERDTSALWQSCIHRRQEIFIERKFVQPACAPARVVTLETRALLGGIRQLVITVRQLVAADVELEPLGD